MIRKLWNFCGDIKVNFWLIFAISLNLAAGAYFIKYNPKLFAPLNQSLIQDWFAAYGQYEPVKSLWFVILLVLAFFLGVNTFVCAVKRIFQLRPQRRQLGFRMFAVRMAPSLIHLCFLVILAGHFSSMIIGYQQNIPVQVNQKIVLPQGQSIEVLSRHIERFTAPAAFAGALKQGVVVLRLQSPETTEIGELRFLKPILWQGISIHLDSSMKNVSKKTGDPPELKLIVKKDPGVAPVILCFAVLCLLMFWYFPQRKKI